MNRTTVRIFWRSSYSWKITLKLTLKKYGRSEYTGFFRLGTRAYVKVFQERKFVGNLKKKKKKKLNNRPTVDFPRRTLFQEKEGSCRYLTLATLELPSTSFLKHETQLPAIQAAATDRRQS
jgi:hypothetical protein